MTGGADPARRAVSTGDPVDSKYQYAPANIAVRAGLVFVSGMVGWDGEGRVVSDDPAVQARRAFENLRATLAAAGAGLEDVVLATEYVTDVGSYRAIARVRSEFFKPPFPAATLVEVKGLFRPDLRFEVQAIAVLPNRS